MNLLDEARLTDEELKGFGGGTIFIPFRPVGDAATRKALRTYLDRLRAALQSGDALVAVTAEAQRIEAALGANPRLRTGVPDFIGSGEVVTQSHEVTDEG